MNINAATDSAQIEPWGIEKHGPLYRHTLSISEFGIIHPHMLTDTAPHTGTGKLFINIIPS